MLRVRTVMTGVAGTPWYSNLFFDGTGSVAAQDAASAVWDFWQDWYAFMRVGLRIEIDTFVADIDAATGDVTGGYTVTDVPFINATSTGQALPHSSQALARLVTPLYIAGRRLQGKMFIPGLTVAASDLNGALSAGTASLIVSSFTDLLASGPDLVVWSRKNGVTAPVSSVIAGSEFAVLRSRRD